MGQVASRGAQAVARILEAVRSATRPTLLSDYDGTLAPFRIERDQALPYPGVVEALGRIASSASRLVIVTGRPAAEAARLLGLAPMPEIWGVHGLERLRPGDGRERCALEPAQEAGIARARRWAEERGLAFRLEEKPGALALHLRDLQGSSEAAALEAAVRDAWEEVARASALELLTFDGGIEIRPPGRDKGDVVRAVLAEEPAGATLVYLGDDLTDEDAFAALEGRGLAVLVRPEPRPSRARYWIRPPEELLELLEGWAAAVGGER